MDKDEKTLLEKIAKQNEEILRNQQQVNRVKESKSQEDPLLD